MKLRTVVLGLLGAGVVYAVRKQQNNNAATDAVSKQSRHTKPTTPGGSSRKARTAVRQLEENSRYAPFPVNIGLTVAAKLLGRRMDSK